MKLAYREVGTGKPLIILHGLFGQSDNWNTLAKKFAENGFRVFTLDQRNHGLSPHDERWDFQSMAKDLHEFIADHHLNEPVLLGHSMGGKTVLFFEHLFPGEADSLIIADIAARGYEARHDTVLEALNAVDLGTIKNRKEAEQVLNKFISDFGTKQFLLKNLYWKDEQHQQLDWRFNLKTITNKYEHVSEPVPDYTSLTRTLIIKGEKSNYITEQDREDYKKRFSHVSFVEIENAGHWVHAERPTEFLNSVLDFISV